MMTGLNRRKACVESQLWSSGAHCFGTCGEGLFTAGSVELEEAAHLMAAGSHETRVLHPHPGAHHPSDLRLPTRSCS